MPVAERRLLQDVIGLHQDLHRQAGGKNLHQLGMLDRLHVADADQVIRKHSQVLRVEPVLAERLEEGVVLRFLVFAFDLKLGYRDGLGAFDRLGQALAEGFEGTGAVLENEGVRLRALAPFDVRVRHREEPLGLERREPPMDAPPPVLGQRVPGRSLGQQARHRLKVEHIFMHRPDRGFEAFRAPSRR